MRKANKFGFFYDSLFDIIKASWCNMKYSIKNASISIDGNAILDYVNFEIKDKDHVGIVGKNGAGKTTLLRALIDNDLFEEGMEDEPFTIQKIGTFSIGYQSQITFQDESVTLIDEVKNSFKDLIDIEKRLDKLTDQMKEDQSEELIAEYTHLLDRFQILGGYTYKKEYETMINKFGFKEEDKTRPLSSFSGGEKTKIAFIKLLLSKPDLLFLDEPTNHLDLDAIEWLEDYLKNYKGAFVLVSHDRMFLNNTVNVIYDVSYGRTTRYAGNYDFFEKKREEDYERTLKDYERQQKEIKRLHDLYERFRNKPKKASMALSKLHMIEKMDIIDKPNPVDDRSFRISMDKVSPSAKRVLIAKNLEVGYDETLAKLNFEVNSGDRIGIIGANGTGKSTLLKTLVDILKPKRGSITYGANVSLGYFDQTLAMESSKNTVLEEFESAHPELLHEEARSALGAFLFRGEDVYKNVEVLSGGEKVRLSLCKILYDRPNLLILDEPTNHMDIVGKKRLEDILKIYKGTIIFVSHDRYFVNKIATKLIVFDNGGATLYNCGYEDYLAKKRNEEKPLVVEQKEKMKKVASIKETPKVNTYSAKKELNKVENEITTLEKEKRILTDELSDPNIYSNYLEAQERDAKIKTIDEKLNILNEKWSKLVDEIS